MSPCLQRHTRSGPARLSGGVGTPSAKTVPIPTDAILLQVFNQTSGPLELRWNQGTSAPAAGGAFTVLNPNAYTGHLIIPGGANGISLTSQAGGAVEEVWVGFTYKQES